MYKTPSTVIQTGHSGATNRMLELKLMHNYTSFTSKTLTPTTRTSASEAVWTFDVPKLAFGGATYLADAILAVSALHLRSKDPDDKALVRASHGYMASSLVAYRDALRAGLDESNSEALFLTATLIAFQSTATRIFAGDEPSVPAPSSSAESRLSSETPAQTRPPTTYTAPLSCFHAFQGVKAVVVSSWPWIRNSSSVLSVIESQPPLRLEGLTSPTSFFGPLLDGLDEETETGEEGGGGAERKQATADAYAHAVAVLNWAHRSPNDAAQLVFPATVARRFIELLAEGRPRALAVLANFFAVLRRMEGIWWVGSVPRREILAIAALFEGEDEQSRRWRRHVEWPVRIACAEAPIPPELWGSEWRTGNGVGLEIYQGLTRESFVTHIEQVARMMMTNPVQGAASGFFSELRRGSGADGGAVGESTGREEAMMDASGSG
jgi:hypothetical protein